MPLVTETDQRPKRLRSVWLLILAAMALPLAGIIAWSCYQPVVLAFGLRFVGFGRMTEIHIPGNAQRGPGYALVGEPGYVGSAVKLPGGKKTGWYVVSASWR